MTYEAMHERAKLLNGAQKKIMQFMEDMEELRSEAVDEIDIALYKGQILGAQRAMEELEQAYMDTRETVNERRM